MNLVTEKRSVLAVSLADAKHHCRVETDDDDGLITRQIRSAMRLLEERSNIYAVPTALEHRQDQWSDPIVLSAWPIREVTQVQYLDEQHVLQVLPSENWFWLRANGHAEVCFADDVTLPSLSNRPQAVRVFFSAGFDDPANEGDDPETAPDERVAQAILVTVGHWYENRETVTIGVASNEVSLAFDALARQLRILR